LKSVARSDKLHLSKLYPLQSALPMPKISPSLPFHDLRKAKKMRRFIATKCRGQIRAFFHFVVLLAVCHGCSMPVNIIDTYSWLKNRGVAKVYVLPLEQTHRIARTVVQWAAYSAPRRLSDSTGRVVYLSEFDSHHSPAFLGQDWYTPGMGQTQVAAWLEDVGVSDSIRVTFAASGVFVRQTAGEILHSYFAEAQSILARGDSLPVQRPRQLQVIE
jgi:hypothetical protein